MAADDDRSIAEQIDSDPSLVGVTAAEDRDGSEPATADTGRERPTWRDLWAFYRDRCSWEFPHTLSQTQLATAVCGHPETNIQKIGAAKQRIADAVDSGSLINTGQYGTRYAVREDEDSYV